MTSLTGILTAVDAMKCKVEDTYSRLGAGRLSLSGSDFPAEEGRKKNGTGITAYQAEEFCRLFSQKAQTSMSCRIPAPAAVTKGQRKCRPNTELIGTDGHFLETHRLEIRYGRNFFPEEISRGLPVCLLSRGAAAALFGEMNPTGEKIRIGCLGFTVIGMLSGSGSQTSGNMDSRILLPYRNLLSFSSSGEKGFTLTVLPPPDEDPVFIAEEAAGCLRPIRRLTPCDRDDFRIVRSDAALSQLEKTIRIMTAAGMLIGLITLGGAAVGLMNILFLDVKERIGEIGMRKAIGASSSDIRRLFTIEAVVICEGGGAAGILAGLLTGNLVAALMHMEPVLPWIWMAAAFLICLLTGMFSGAVPAGKAASTDPSVCLRKE